jgi:GGDEF domain-containing protein
MDSDDRTNEKTWLGVNRILDKDYFFYFLDLEVKRARRYQNFLSLMLLKLIRSSNSDNGGGLQVCYQVLSDLLTVEMRESDILGSLGENQLIVLLPYADESAGRSAKSRFESTLKYYDLKTKGYEVKINQVYFPMNGTDTVDLIKRALAP